MRNDGCRKALPSAKPLQRGVSAHPHSVPGSMVAWTCILTTKVNDASIVCVFDRPNTALGAHRRRGWIRGLKPPVSSAQKSL